MSQSSPATAFGRALSHGLPRRQFLAWTGSAAAVAALAGCSSPGDTTESLTFTLWGTGNEKDAVSKVVNEFAAANKLKGNPQSYPQDYETKLNTLLAGNKAPDAGYLTEGMAMRLGEQGQLFNVLENAAFSTFLPTALHYYAPDKAVSQTCIEATALFYDEDAVKEAGVTVPAVGADAWNWDDFITAADKLTVDSEGRHPSESGFDANAVVRYGSTVPYLLRPLVGVMASNGVDLFNEDGSACLFDSDAAIEVMQALSDLIFEHRVSPNVAQTTELGASTGLQLASKKVAMAVDGQWALLDLNAAKADGLNYNAGVIPGFGQGAFTVVLSGANGVFNSSNNKESSLELLLALADPEQVPLYADGLWMPPQEKYYTEPAAMASWMDNDNHPSNYKTAVADMAMNNAVAFPSYRLKNFSEIDLAITNTLTSMFTQKTDIAAECKKLATSVNGLMQGVYQDTAS
ncbi:extracellular solute-binding protein [Rathayibacter festucae]|uniref:extracellular solute-binding protein n=1 Tax=Rathayibacter festucae TaxID=110937 RepID=UPI002A6A9D4B|nr:extracellular solute-binding protein [Rathayibacter festucae]MDY0914556.1 extracellular solute-binding protein [Rathayibacter festucae]